MKPAFVDTHVHFYFPDFDSDRQDAIQRARDAGVQYFVNIGTDLESSTQCLELARLHAGFFSTAGLHPNDALKASEDEWKGIENLLKNPKVVAIGEVGLDFYRQHCPADVQMRVLERFLQLYSDIKKPLVIHCRDAYEKLEEVLKHFSKNQYQGVMHCYSSTKEVMFKFLDLGFHISFAGPLTYKKNDALREAAGACPSDRLLLETDAPFLPPDTLRGKRNETAYMIHTAQMAADVRKVSLEEIARQTTQNAVKLFGLC